jgi:uncharacterized surface protein with fasciclin (FAS1) repeats
MLVGQCTRSGAPRTAVRAASRDQEETTVNAPRLSRATVRMVAVAAVPALLAGVASCSSGESGSADATTGSSPSSAAASSTASSASASPAVRTPIGAGCDVFPAEGAGSTAAVAGNPVGIAISTVPQLSTLTQAVIAANLVDVVNTRQDVTLLAPSDAAFNALGPDALPALLADVPRLTTLITHHVLPGRLSPEELVGEHTTLNGDTITVAGPADAPTFTAEQTVPGAATAAVVCGGVPTANATLYVIDQVLAPAG